MRFYCITQGTFNTGTHNRYNTGCCTQVQHNIHTGIFNIL